MAYLLVCTGDTLEAQDYGVSLVWISPNQVRAPTMEEAVGTLSAYISSGPRLALCSCTAIRGLQPYTPSQGQAFRCSAPGKGRGEPLWVD